MYARLTIFLLLLSLGIGGRIIPWGEPILSHPNSGWLNQLDLFFSLDNALPRGHVLAITLPFASQPNFTGVASPISIWTVTTTRGALTLANSQPATGVITTSGISQPTGQLTSYVTLSAALTANTNYQLRISLGSNITDVTGLKGWIQIATMSPANSVLPSGGIDTSIVYDQNNAFAPIHLLDAPGTAIFTIANANASDTVSATTAGASYMAQFSLTPSKQFWLYPTIIFTWDNSLFSLGGTGGSINVTNVDSGLGQVATPLLSSQYSVSLVSATQSTPGKIIILHNSLISTTQAIVYNISIVNPASTIFVPQTSKVSAFIMHRYNLNLSDYSQAAPLIVAPGSAAGASSVTTTYTSCGVQNAKVLLGWGIDRAMFENGINQFVPWNTFRMHLGDATAPTYQFQTLRFQFDVNSTLPNGNYTVTVSLTKTGAGNFVDILENSMTNTFGSATTCSFIVNTATNPAVIQCSNIAKFAATKNSINARIGLSQALSTVGTTAAANQIQGYGRIDAAHNFGQISINSSTAVYTTSSIGVVTTTWTGASVCTTMTPNATYQQAVFEFAPANANAWQIASAAGVPLNGPLVGIASSDPAWNTFKTGTDWTAPATAAPLFSGIFAYGTTGAAQPYNLVIRTQLTGASGTSNVFGYSAGGAQYPAGTGIDLFLNPNLWTISASYSQSSCYWGNIPNTLGTPPYTAPNQTFGGGTGALHCTGVNNTNLATYTRIRAISVSGTDAPSATAATLVSAAATPLSFFWEGFVSLVGGYTGASLQADNFANDFYAVTYQAPPATSPTTVTISATSTAQTDLGDIGGSNFGTVVPCQYWQWSQPIVLPYQAASATVFPYTQYNTAIKVWFAGTYTAATGAPDSTNLLLQLRIRGALTSGTDTFSTSATRLGFLTTTGAAAWPTLVPLYTAGAVPSTPTPYPTPKPYVPIRCVSGGQVGLCYYERTFKTLTIANFMNSPLDGYSLYTAPISQTAGFSVSIFLQPTTFTAATSYNYRLSTIANGLHYLWGHDNLLQVATSTGPTALASQCTVPATGGIRLTPATTDTANFVVPSATLTLQTALSITPTNKYGGFVWCVQWDFRSSNTALGGGKSAFETATNVDYCAFFDYESVEANIQATYYCVVCPGATIPSSTSGSSLTIANLRAPPAVDIPNTHYYAAFADDGSLAEYGICASTSTNLYKPGNATVTSSGSAWSAFGQKVTVTVNTFSTLNVKPAIQQITLVGQSAGSNSTYSVDGNFPYGTLDPAAQCYIVPSTQVSNISAYLSCLAIYGNGQIQIQNYTIPSFYWTVANWVVIIWGHNGVQITSANFTGPSFYMKTVNVNNFLVDQSPTGNTSSIWTIGNVSQALAITNPQYQKPFLNARGYFRWDFTLTSNRTWYYNDLLLFNLDAIISTPINTNSSILKCRITDSNDNIVQIFKSCTFGLTLSQPALSIVSLDKSVLGLDFTVGNLRVYLDNAVTVSLQTNKTIWGRLIFAGNAAYPGQNGALIRLGSVTDNLIPALASSSNFSIPPTVLTYWSGPGEQIDIIFLLTLPSVYNESCRIYVGFPSYYNPGLDTRSNSPVCSIDGVQTYCFVLNNIVSRMLIIDNFPGAKATNTTFRLRISGVSAPTTTYTTENFFLQVNADQSDINSTSLVSAGIVMDNAFVSTAPGAIHVPWVVQNTTLSRTYATNTWSFSVLNLTNATSQAINSSYTIQVIFPDSWMVALGAGQPWCRVYDFFVPTTQYTAKLAPIGNQVFLNVTTTLPLTGVFSLECSGLRTPESDSTTYPNQDIQIRIIQANGGSVAYRSAPSVHNVNYAQVYAKPAGLSTIDWSTATTFNVIRGTYSSVLSLPFNGRSSAAFQVSLANSNFGLWPSVVQIQTGTSTASARLGCATSVPRGYYYLSFQVTSNNAYLVPGSILAQVLLQNYEIPANPALGQSISLPVLSGQNTTSIPVTFDVSGALPFSSVTITPVCPPLQVGVSNANFTVTPSSITLTANNTAAGFVYKTTALTTPPTQTTAGGSCLYSYTISGPNAITYTITGAHIVQTQIADPSTTSTVPTLAIAADSGDQGAATSKILSFNLGAVTTATVYYVIGIIGRVPITQTAIVAGALAMSQYNPNDPNQLQYGVFSQTQGSVQKTISNLIPSENYEVRAYAISQFGVGSVQAQFNWQTGFNGAVMQRWIFNYTTYPSVSQRQALFCSLTSLLQVAPMKVIGVNGDYCGNTSVFYTVANTTGDLSVYFYPLNAEVDNVMSTVGLQTVLNASSTASALNASVATNAGSGFANIYQAETYIQNIQLTGKFGSANVTTNSIAFTAAMNDTGFVYAAVTSLSNFTPSIWQLKYAGQNKLFNGSSVVWYSPSFAVPTVNFTGLAPATTYNLWIMGSNNDPSFLANYTGSSTLAAGPQSVSVTTPAATVSSAIQMSMVFIGMIIALLSINLI